MVRWRLLAGFCRRSQWRKGLSEHAPRISFVRDDDTPFLAIYDRISSANGRREEATGGDGGGLEDGVDPPSSAVVELQRARSWPK